MDINRGSGGDSLFQGLAEYLDKQVSKGVLGQTMTTDDGASLSQARVHGDVKQEFVRADAFALQATIQEGLVRPWVQLNYGEGSPVPNFKIVVDPPEDLELFTRTVLPWVQAGLRVDAQEIRDKFGVSDPAETGAEEILGGAPEPTGEVTGEVTGEAAGEEERALNAARKRVRAPISVEPLTIEALDQWERVMEPHRVAIEALADRSQNYDEFRVGLAGLALEFDSDPFVQLLATTMAKARGVGGA